MKVKAGDTWYDSNEVPIMLEVNLGEQRMIGDMDRALAPSGRYAQIPSERFGWDDQDMRDWMHGNISAEQSGNHEFSLRSTDLRDDEIEVTEEPLNERSVAVYLLDLPHIADGKDVNHVMVITAKPSADHQKWETVHYHVGKDESILRSMINAGCKKNAWYWITVSEYWLAQVIDDEETEDIVNDGLSEESLNNGE